MPAARNENSIINSIKYQRNQRLCMLFLHVEMPAPTIVIMFLNPCSFQCSTKPSKSTVFKTFPDSSSSNEIPSVFLKYFSKKSNSFFGFSDIGFLSCEDAAPPSSASSSLSLFLSGGGGLPLSLSFSFFSRYS